jgi:hypothetical protein
VSRDRGKQRGRKRPENIVLLFSCSLSSCSRAATYRKHRNSTVLYRSFGCCPSHAVLGRTDERRRKWEPFPSKQTNVLTLEVNIVQTRPFRRSFPYRHDGEVLSLKR